jgi:membrane protease YdiL (CAAX protease family)
MIWIYYVILAVGFPICLWLTTVFEKAYSLSSQYLLVYGVEALWIALLFRCASKSLVRNTAYGWKADHKRLALRLGSFALLGVCVGLIWRFNTHPVLPSVLEHLFIALILAPVIEELVFRRYLFNQMLSVHSVNWAIVINGLIFTAAHIDLGDLPDYRAICSWFGAGMFFCVVYTYCGYRAAVIAHLIGNYINFVITGK